MSIDDLLDNIMGGMTREEAFFALIAAAVHIDGDVDDRELEELEALVHRTRTLSMVSESDMQQIRERTAPRLLPDRIEGLISDACASLSSDGEDVRLSLFAHVCDMVMADRVFRSEEKMYLKTLIQKLNISQESAAMVMKALKAKNEH